MIYFDENSDIKKFTYKDKVYKTLTYSKNYIYSEAAFSAPDKCEKVGALEKLLIINKLKDMFKL